MYHIIKKSRFYEGHAYTGISCHLAGVEPGKTYKALEDATSDAYRLLSVNPVGWLIVDTETGETVRVVESFQEVH